MQFMTLAKDVIYFFKTRKFVRCVLIFVLTHMVVKRKQKSLSREQYVCVKYGSSVRIEGMKLCACSCYSNKCQCLANEKFALASE